MAYQNITENQSIILAEAISLYMKVEDITPKQFIGMLGSLSSQALEDKFDDMASSSIEPVIG